MVVTALTGGLQEDDVRGRLLVLLGRQQQIPLGSANVGETRELFVAGNIDFRAGGGRIIVAFVILTIENVVGNVLVDPGVSVRLGAQATPDDWLGGNLNIGGVLAPYTFLPQQFVAGTAALMPIYAVGTPFVFTNGSVSASSQTGTISVYGWAEN